MADTNHPIRDAWLDPAPTHDGDRRATDLGARSGGTADRVETGRRAALDHTIDRFGARATAAATAIVPLAEGAGSEAVRPRAARAVPADLMAVETDASLDSRLTEVERRLDREPIPCGGPNGRESGLGSVPCTTQPGSPVLGARLSSRVGTEYSPQRHRDNK